MLSCKTEEEVADLLRDIGTLSELQSWGERLEVAKQLAKGLSYRVVSKNTGASTTTVTRVAKFIENGTGGYRRLLKAHRHHRLMLPVQGTEPSQALSRELEKKAPITSPLQKYLTKKED
jgi:TrpR-related protein YerC/YecD